MTSSSWDYPAVNIFRKKVHHIQIRYNTKDVDNKLPWRVFVDGIEHLASQVYVKGFLYGESSLDGKVIKWNMACYGKIKWDGSVATIKTKSKPPQNYHFLQQ